MELRSPKAKKKSPFNQKYCAKMLLRPSFLVLFLLGTINCDGDEKLVELKTIPNSNLSDILPSDSYNSKWRPGHREDILVLNDTWPRNKFRGLLSDIRFLRRHLNKEIVNFVMTDKLIDGEFENRIHYNGITAKETYVGTTGNGLKLRQLTDGSHLVQVIYAQNGDVQDCEYITQTKRARHFLKSMRNELKSALDELYEKTMNHEHRKDETDNDKFFHVYQNVSFRLLKGGEMLPVDIAEWFDYDELKIECLKRHEEMKYMLENRNVVSERMISRSLRENFIVPGTKWCGAGQLAQTYNELGTDLREDRCCRTHDNCRVNIGPFSRRFGHVNISPFTVSHCQCDRRFRACLKLADTSVSNMVGKVFFNVVQTKCFVLKYVKICKKRSWWGKCLERGSAKKAILRNNLPY